MALARSWRRKDTRCLRKNATTENLPRSTYSHDRMATTNSVTMAVTKLLSGETHCSSPVDPSAGVIRPATHEVHSDMPSLSA